MLALSQDEFYKIFKKSGNPEHINFPAAQKVDVDVIIALTNAFRPKTFLEIGINLGHTARRVLQFSPFIQSYVGIDIPFESKETAGKQAYEVPEIPASEVKDPRVKIVTRPFGVKNIDPVELGTFDFIFIDGDHSYEGIEIDTEYCEKILNPGGVISWHDFPSLPFVYKYIMESNAKYSNERIICVQDTLIAFRIGRP